MNRKNLTAAVLAGLAAIVGIAGSAQAALLDIGNMFATGPPAVIVMNVPDAVARPSNENMFDTMATLNIVEREVPDLVGEITSNEAVQHFGENGRENANTDTLSWEGMSDTQFVALPAT